MHRLLPEQSLRPAISYAHGTSTEPLVAGTIGSYFDCLADRQAGKDAVVEAYSGRRLTYRDLRALTDSLAAGLAAAGIGRGSRVGIWSGNNIEWVITQLATAKIGSILVNINPAYRLHELEYALRQSGVTALVLVPGFKDDEYVSMLRELSPELFNPEMSNPSPRLPELRLGVLIGSKAGCGLLPFDSLIEAGGKESPELVRYLSGQLSFDDPINIQYTSGTTGFPKGVTLSHHNLINNALYAAEAMGIDESSRFCAPMPFYHCGGMVLSTLATLLKGGALVIPSPSFDAGAVLSAVERERCTHLAGVPTMFIAELQHPLFAGANLKSLTGGFMAGAPCPVKLMRQVASDMHMSEVVIFYGQTECSPVITSTTTSDSLDRRATSVGRVVAHMEVKVIDVSTGECVARGQQGEICARGYAVMLGYWKNEKATAEAVDQARWLHTGDLGTMDDAGYLNITGRKKDLIIRGGENIYPRELEELLHAHPAIGQAHVFSVPDAYFGEEVCAWIQLKPDHRATADEVRSWLSERVAHFKVPRHVRFVDDFPMTVSGKVQKFVMREAMIAELGLQAADSIETA